MLELSWKSAPLDDARAALGRLVDAVIESAAELAPEVTREGDDVLVALHPAAAPITLRAESDRITMHADTGTAGPGYHEEVDALMRAAAKATGIVWEDSSIPDRVALEHAMDDWLASTAREIVALADRGATGFSILLPDGVEYAHTQLLATPLGPRDRAWLERVKTTPSAGRDVLAWWDHGRGAAYFAGLARALAWTEVRWRSPIDDRERTLLDRVVTAIERAHGLDPSIDLPWLEAAEIYELLGEDSLRATRAGVLAEGLRKRGARDRIGYRRNAVRVSLSGGWSLVIPGELAERWEERGTWVGWDRRRTIWMSSMTAEGDGASSTEAVLAGLPELPGEGDLLRMERGPILGHARFAIGEDDGKPCAVLRAHAACGKHVALGTIILPEDADRTWALETWGTLDRDDADVS
jgi:hypothetical protein